MLDLGLLTSRTSKMNPHVCELFALRPPVGAADEVIWYHACTPTAMVVVAGFGSVLPLALASHCQSPNI